MIRYVIWKFLRALAIVIGVTLITFLLMHAVPGNPWSNYADAPQIQIPIMLDQTQEQELNRRFGLDLPLWRQFARYVIGDFNEDGSFFCGAVCGNLGPSLRQRGRSVQDVLFAPPENKTFWQSRFGYSIRLVFYGSVFAISLGVALGILIAATKPRVSQTISFILATLISIPSFVLGLLAIIVLASWLKIINVLPNWDNPGHWIVPILVLSVVPMAGSARVTSESIKNTLSEDYVRTARSKGMKRERVLLVHVLRNALVPIITFLGPTMVEMMVGLFIIENLYAFPGFGKEYWESVLKLDYPMIMGLTIVYAVGMALVALLVDILGAALDPRIRVIHSENIAQ
jgi:oligopeptide transport system permease protein